jgi:exopolysaccharide biosynthesis WecB/TagA/CpsF family protein
MKAEAGLAVLRHMRIVPAAADEASLVAELTHAAKPTVLAFCNQHAVNLCWSKPGFAEALREADILLRDGVGVEVALAALGWPAGVNMVGTSFLPRLLAAFAGRRVALYGTAEPWLSRAADAVSAMGCIVVSRLDGFQESARYVTDAAATPSDLILLAMGMPKQEFVAAALSRALSRPVVIANGGAIADYLANRFARAPLWVQRARLEWVFRLALEPKRLWRRYGIGGVLFLLRIGQMKSRLRRMAAG